MYTTILFLSILLICCIKVCGECPNGCNGHGECTLYDMCICWRNWQGNDCSERMCQFGRNFVDTPKGDLDSSGEYEGPSQGIKLDNSFQFPYGTSELFPMTEDTDGNVLTQTAHEYVECSGTGLCNRTSGVCNCFPGFEGSACQRLACPGMAIAGNGGSKLTCSGHGVCYVLSRVAELDHGSVYKLWDKDASTTCVCEPGYWGPDCHMRRCPYALDPLYLDDVIRLKYWKIYLAVVTSSRNQTTRDFTAGYNEQGPGTFAIRFYDYYGNEWLTHPIEVGATCDDVTEALEGIPHNTIPKGSITCYKTSVVNQDPLNPRANLTHFGMTYYSRYKLYLRSHWDEFTVVTPTFWSQGFRSSFDDMNVTTDEKLTGDIYRLEFMGNPGGFKEPEVDLFTDGTRPTVMSSSGHLVARMWTDGEQGESVDYFGIHCGLFNLKIVIRITASGIYYFDGWNSWNQRKAFQLCIGTSDADPSNDIGVVTEGSTYKYWDHGSPQHPHVVRLVKTVTDHTDGGQYVLFYFDTSGEVMDSTNRGGAFRILHPFHSTYKMQSHDEEKFDVFATRGYLTLASNTSVIQFDFASRQLFATNITYDIDRTGFEAEQITGERIDQGDISCEAKGLRMGLHNTCLEKGDKFFLLDPYTTSNNPPFMNFYTAMSLYKVEFTASVQTYFPEATNPEASHFMKNVINTDISTNWANDASEGGLFHVYKFTMSPTESGTGEGLASFSGSGNRDREGVYEYIAECANRGICNHFEGTCDCFKGYAGNACEIQDLEKVML